MIATWSTSGFSRAVVIDFQLGTVMLIMLDRMEMSSGEGGFLLTLAFNPVPGVSACLHFFLFLQPLRLHEISVNNDFKQGLYLVLLRAFVEKFLIHLHKELECIVDQTMNGLQEENREDPD